MAPLTDAYPQHPFEFKPHVTLWSTSPVDSKGRGPIHEFAPPSPSLLKAKRVTFGATEVVNHTSLSDFSNEEISACWYTRADRRKFRQERRDAIESMALRKPLANDDCAIGIEMMTPHENALCGRRIYDAIHAVLDEQEEQMRYDGYCNQEILAACYSSYTYRCRDLAYELGQWHQNQAYAPC